MGGVREKGQRSRSVFGASIGASRPYFPAKNDVQKWQV